MLSLIIIAYTDTRPRMYVLVDIDAVLTVLMKQSMQLEINFNHYPMISNQRQSYDNETIIQ